VDPTLTFTRAEGAYIYDADGTRYIDYHAAFGPIVLGHCHPEVNARVTEAIGQIDIVGVGTGELETQLAAKLVEHIPSAEKVMLCNSGSEATYSALRVARAATGKRKLIKFQGCYHGWHDAVLMNVITPAELVGQRHPLSAGMSPGVVEDTLVLRFNDVDELSKVIAEQGDEIAAVILEMIPHNVGAILPTDEFLASLRSLTTEHNIVLIFDEVVTGFRHTLGGYQHVRQGDGQWVPDCGALRAGRPDGPLRPGRRRLLRGDVQRAPGEHGGQPDDDRDPGAARQHRASLPPR
jgi:glutamate-1-semialdehyde 2,1-aminomutase